MVSASLLAFPHLFDEIWYDEAYTLEFFARSPAMALTDFHLPNNHPLFSLLVWCWGFNFGSQTLRFLPFLMFLGAIHCTMKAAGRIGGPGAGAMAGVFLGTHHSFLNYSCQLRGYVATVFFFAAALNTALEHRSSGTRRSLCLFILWQVLCTSVMPTAGLVGAPLALVAIPHPKSCILKLAFLFLAPFAGLGIYVLNFEQFLSVAKTLDVSMTRQGLLVDAWDGFLGYWVLLPVVSSIILLTWGEKSIFNRTLSLVGVSTLLSVIFLLVMPRTPYARNLFPLLVPLSVMAAIPMTALLGSGLRCLLATGLLLIGGGMNEQNSAGYFDRHRMGDKPETLVDLYHHHSFRPSMTAALTHSVAGAGSALVILDNSDLWSLRHAFRHVANLPPWMPVVFSEVLDIKPELKEPDRFLKVLAISRNEQGANDLADMLVKGTKNPLPTPQLRHDTGYFKIWELVRN